MKQTNKYLALKGHFVSLYNKQTITKCLTQTIALKE